MGSKIVYIIVFVLAFVATTGAIYFLNARYENIFAFDFSAPKAHAIAEKKQKEKPVEPKADSLTQNSADSTLASGDTLKTAPAKNESEKKSEVIQKLSRELSELKAENAELKQIKTEVIKKEQQISKLKNNIHAKNDSAYVKWKKEVVKIYESMDPKAAARIIQKLPDNVAKDVIFQMKKKKAAQIVSLLSPELANRLTRIH